jgi:hypothetical protein
MKYRFIALMMLVLVLASTSICAGAEYNVALGAQAKANSVYGGLGPENAVDGNYDLHWSSTGFASLSNPLWMAVDLGNVYSLTHVDLYSHISGGSYYGYGINYNLYYSTDSDSWNNDTSWTFIASGSLYTTDILTDYFNSIDFDNKSARYLKFEVTGGTHWAHLYELEAYTQQGAAVPEPPVALLLAMGIGALSCMRLFQKEKIQL